LLDLTAVPHCWTSLLYLVDVVIAKRSSAQRQRVGLLREVVEFMKYEWNMKMPSVSRSLRSSTDARQLTRAN
jgi:hypothetical protein